MSSLVVSEVVRFGPEPGNEQQIGFSWNIVCDVPTTAQCAWENIRQAYLNAREGQRLSVVVSPSVSVPAERFPDMPRGSRYDVTAARVWLGYGATLEGSQQPTLDMDIDAIYTLENVVKGAAAILSMTVAHSPELTVLLEGHAAPRHRQTVVMNKAATPIDVRAIKGM
jgi:hypothetical protein